jgi:methyl-accepting chemotaxis protein
MDFDDAIVSHLKWKIRLHDFLSGKGGKLDSATVADARACELGRWMDGEGRRYQEVEDYRALVEKHTAFHRVAAEVLRLAESGDRAGAMAMLANGREFSSASRGIVGAIMRLEQRVKGRAPGQ